MIADVWIVHKLVYLTDYQLFYVGLKIIFKIFYSDHQLLVTWNLFLTLDVKQSF
jgi:hypothetical protein